MHNGGLIIKLSKDGFKVPTSIFASRRGKREPGRRKRNFISGLCYISRAAASKENRGKRKLLGTMRSMLKLARPLRALVVQQQQKRCLNVHEYVSMDVMRGFGIPVPRGGMATNLDEVRNARRGVV